MRRRGQAKARVQPGRGRLAPAILILLQRGLHTLYRAGRYACTGAAPCLERSPGAKRCRCRRCAQRCSSAVAPPAAALAPRGRQGASLRLRLATNAGRRWTHALPLRCLVTCAIRAGEAATPHGRRGRAGPRSDARVSSVQRTPCQVERGRASVRTPPCGRRAVGLGPLDEHDAFVWTIQRCVEAAERPDARAARRRRESE